MPDAGWCDLLYRTHDSERFASSKSNLPWPSKSLDLNQMGIFGMSLIGWLGDGPFQCKTITAILMDRWKAIAQHTCLRNFDAQLSPGRQPGHHPSKWRSCQVSSPMNFVVRIEFRNFMNVLM